MRPWSPVPKKAVRPSGDNAPHQTNAASTAIGLGFIPGTTAPSGRIKLAVASPSSKSLAEVCRKVLVIAAPADAAASARVATSAGASRLASLGFVKFGKFGKFGRIEADYCKGCL